MRKHDAWFDAQAKQTALGVKVYNTIVPSAAAMPYAVYYPRDGVDRVTSLSGPASQANPSWLIHGVGATTDQAKWVIEQLKKRFIADGFGVVPVIAGENPGRVWFSSAETVDVDDDTNPPRVFQVAECGFSSDLIAS